MRRRGFLGAIPVLLGFSLGVKAAELQAGRDFRQISPPLATEGGRIEVIEFFWYGCPHCFNFEPVLAAWAAKLPADVVMRRVPALFPNNKWLPSAKLYYTLEAMNLLDRLHGAAFNAIHVERKRLDEEKFLLEWVASKGIDAKKFSETWSSFGVQSRVRQAMELTQSAGLSGVPALVVQGRYLAIMPESFPELTALADQLIERVRTEAGRK